MFRNISQLIAIPLDMNANRKDLKHGNEAEMSEAANRDSSQATTAARPTEEETVSEYLFGKDS